MYQIYDHNVFSDGTRLVRTQRLRRFLEKEDTEEEKTVSSTREEKSLADLAVVGSQKCFNRFMYVFFAH